MSHGYVLYTITGPTGKYGITKQKQTYHVRSEHTGQVELETLVFAEALAYAMRENT